LSTTAPPIEPEIAEYLAHQHLQINALSLTKKSGKTAALKTGITATSGEIVIVQDADLEYDPREIAEVIAPIVQGHADVVYGSRF
jgi:glycosyltransferase involved in cell wall biosynthesis